MSFNDISQNPSSTVNVGTAKNTNLLRTRTHYFNADGSKLTYSAVRLIQHRPAKRRERTGTIERWDRNFEVSQVQEYVSASQGSRRTEL